MYCSGGCVIVALVIFMAVSAFVAVSAVGVLAVCEFEYGVR